MCRTTANCFWCLLFGVSIENENWSRRSDRGFGGGGSGIWFICIFLGKKQKMLEGVTMPIFPFFFERGSVRSPLIKMSPLLNRSEMDLLNTDYWIIFLGESCRTITSKPNGYWRCEKKEKEEVKSLRENEFELVTCLIRWQTHKKVKLLPYEINRVSVSWALTYIIKKDYSPLLMLIWWI